MQRGCSHRAIADSRGSSCCPVTPLPGQNIILYASKRVIIHTGVHRTEVGEIKLSLVIAAARN